MFGLLESPWGPHANQDSVPTAKII